MGVAKLALPIKASLDNPFLVFFAQIQAGQYPLGLRQVADEFAQGRGEFLDQRGDGDDVPLFGKDGLLVDVDDFKFKAALQMFLANLFHILYGPLRIGGHA